MIKIISFSIILTILFFSIKYIKKTYEKMETLFEKVLYVISWMIIFVWLIFYYLDRYDIPTKTTFLNNMDTERWFSFTSNYIIGMIGQIISGAILVLITLKQINVQNTNDETAKRIQNAPIFKYSISNNKMDGAKEFYLYNGTGKIYNIFFKIENIGFNHARHINVAVSGQDISKECIFKLDDSQGILKKDDSVLLDLVINYTHRKTNDMKIINVVVTYEDLLGNKYMQQISIKGEATDILGSQHAGYKFNIVEYKIDNEKYVEEKKVK